MHPRITPNPFKIEFKVLPAWYKVPIERRPSKSFKLSEEE